VTPAVIGGLWQGWQPAADQASCQPGNIGGDDRYNSVTRQLLYEQIPKARAHQLQWRDRGAQFTVECGSARKAPDPEELASHHGTNRMPTKRGSSVQPAADYRFSSRHERSAEIALARIHSSRSMQPHSTCQSQGHEGPQDFLRHVCG
jgi:hypothetical protein